MLTRSSLAGVAVATCLLLGGVTLSRVVDANVSVRLRKPSLAGSYVPLYEPVGGMQVEMVFFGAASCGWSNMGELPGAVESIKTSLAQYAADRAMSFRAVGVALDWSPQLGVEFLGKFGQFDEISAGSNWGNTMALRDVWDPVELHPQTPQVVVYLRDLAIPSDGDVPARFVEHGRRRVRTLIGVADIVAWADAGTPLGDMTDAETSRAGKSRGDTAQSQPSK